MSGEGQRAPDIGAIIDRGRWSGYQKRAAALVALIIIFDGFDNQALGFALPAIIGEWGVDRAAFAPVVALGLVGMAIGTAFGGIVGDRIGRRPTLIGSMLLFALATGGIAWTHDLAALGALRFLAGAGIGGALPNAAALTAELTPLRHRAVAVTLTIVCVPVGGIVGALLAARLLPGIGWRALFVIGAAAAIALALLLLAILPESPRYLARHPGRSGELARLLRRCGLALPAAACLAEATGTVSVRRGGAPALFEAGQRRDTLGLWVAFFCTLLAVYAAFSWMPAMLAAAGLDLATASTGLTAYNSGGVAGALVGAALIGRHGSRSVMTLLALGGALSALLLLRVPVHAAGPYLALIALLGVHGFFVNGVQTTLYALAAHAYPTAVRATGTGAALGIGRFGAILSSFAGAVVLASGAGGYYLMLAAAMGCAAAGLLAVRRHIPGRRARAAR